MNDELCKIAMSFNEPDSFDSNGMLFNFYNHLYKNNLNGIKSLALEQLYDTAKRLYKNDYKNKSMCRFLNRISHLAFENDNYEDYAFINELIYILYCNRLEIKDSDIKQIAFDFSTKYFRFNYYNVNRNQNLAFCDNLTSYLLRFISNLIRRKEFKAVLIIFDNITFKNKNINEQDLSELEILNFQFVCGIIFCIYLTYEKNGYNEKENELIQEIVQWLQYNLFSFYDAWHIIYCFKKYFEKTSCVQKVYDDFNYTFENSKFKSWSFGSYIDNKLVLRELLVAFNISFALESDANYDEIGRDDLNYYQRLLEIILDVNSSCFSKILNVSYKNDEVIKLLNLIIDNAQRKEEEYLKTNKLNEKKVKIFEKEIKKSINENDDLIEYLKEIKKVENKKYKLKIVYGINELIPRELFFDDYFGLESIATDLGKTVKDGITDDYIEKIRGISKNLDKDINDIIKEISNIEDYVLISDCIHYREIKNYDYLTDTININDKKVSILKIPKVDSFYLINKDNLPVLEYCGFADIYSKKNINTSIFYEFKDCSQDEALRNSIIQANNWLSEKGDIDEQHNYLKKKCSLKVFLSFKIRKVKKSEAIQINYKIN